MTDSIDRLALAETGQQFLADADLTTIPISQATWAATTRRPPPRSAPAPGDA